MQGSEAEELYARLAAEHPDVYLLDGGPGGVTRVGFGAPVPLEPGAVLPGLRAAVANAPLGLVGRLDAALRAETMGMPLPPDADPGRAPAAFLRVEREWELPLAPRDVTFEASVARDVQNVTLRAKARVTRRDTDAAYLAKIAACQEAIRRGDAYLLCLTTTCATDPADGPVDVLATARRLRESSATGWGGVLRTGGSTLVSATPERFLEVADGVVRTRPIKGTRPRDPDPAEDTRLAAELAADEKERAENLMIVDLMRNDLARLCPPGSVAVPSLFAVESHPQVHQLVSTVEGRLAPGRDAIDAIAACFPAGSMTGTPKRRALELLDELEGEGRGAYAGAFGRLGPDGSADLRMTIRTIVVDDAGRATIGAGGGITALSDPAAELAEVALKARALLDAVTASPVR
jgi:para-aminobenzoate synthetase component I